MKIIVCLDDNNGMLFNKRRQSRDEGVRNRIFEIIGDSKLWMNSYSATLFTGSEDKIIVDEKCLKKADSEDYCFIENLELQKYADKINSLIIYRWNRIYPSDFKFSLPLENWKLNSKFDFVGTSHDKITEEIYIR